MKTFGVTDYTNLVPLKCCGRTDGQTDGRTDRRTDGQTDGQPDGRSGPTTRPAFAKATQVKICAMTELIALSLHKHTLLEFTKRSYLKLLGHSPLCYIMSVLLEHMNILVTSEENFEISSKRYQRNQMSQTDK